MLIRDLLFTLLIIAGGTVSFSLLWGSMATTYGVPAPTESLASFNQTTRVVAIANQMSGNQTGILGLVQGIPILGEIASIMFSGLSLLDILFQVPLMFSSMITDLGGMIGMPAWFSNLIIWSLIIWLTFEIISAAIIKGRV